MSQFAILVVGPESYRELEDTLAPYDEHLTFPPYIKFNRADKKAEKKRLKKYYRAELRKTPNDIGLQNKLIALQQMSDEQYFDHCTRFYDDSALNTVGEPISTYNPNSKFDSWEHTILLASRKCGGSVSTTRKNDMNWDLMSIHAHDQAAVDWIRLQTYSDKQKRLVFDWWPGETRRQYINRKRVFHTHAYVYRGKWYERGKIGWWGSVTEEIPAEKWMEQYAEMLTSLKDDTVLTTVMCRI